MREELMCNVLKITTFAAAAALALIGVASPASATMVRVTYTGTVSSGYDYAGGVFGPPNTSLTGDPYTASYLFDTTLGITLSSPNLNYAYGGSAYGAVPSPSLSAVLTINGGTLTMVGSYISDIYGNDSGISEAFHWARDRSETDFGQTVLDRKDQYIIIQYL
jgi:hypothetical protein